MAIDIDSTMQLTSQNQFMRSLSGGYKRTNGSRVCKLFFKNERRSHQRKRSLWLRAVSHWKLTIDEPNKNDDEKFLIATVHSRVTVGSCLVEYKQIQTSASVYYNNRRK